MIHKLRPLSELLILYGFLLLAGLLLLQHTSATLTLTTYATLLTIMTLITIGAYFLGTLGIRRGNKDQGIWMLAGLNGKFLAYLVVILIYWVNGKNFTKDFIIAFFVLYLLLTIFLIRTLFKKLKNN